MVVVSAARHVTTRPAARPSAAVAPSQLVIATSLVGEDRSSQRARRHRIGRPFQCFVRLDAARRTCEAPRVSEAGSPGLLRERPLLERERELAAAAECLTRARAGSGSVLIVEGPPGIGKTVLLEAIRAAAADMGMERLSAYADELEREFAYGVVRLLVEPALHRAGPTRREALLEGAARFAASVVAADERPVLPVASDATPSVLHGLYWLISNLAEHTPYVLTVDDAHWADAASLRFLHYLARRLGELPVLLVVAVRTGEAAAGVELL